jgi:transglutaminase-like putative cysteine protease
MIDPRIRRPDEGWLTLGLVVLMIAILASAIDDPSWVNGRGSLTDGLVLLGLLGVALGFIGPKVGWGRWTTHMVGALFGGLLIPIVAGWAEYPGLPLGQTFAQTASGAVNAYLDLAWRGLAFTPEEVHYVIVLGIVVWATGQFAAYAVFGHHRPLNAVILSGIVLLANISSTFRDQLPYLVAFSIASLFLLIQMHAFDERATWIRRRIGDPSTISSLYLRGGTVFILAAMVGSLLLTARAVSSPLAGAWGPVRDQMVEVGETISRFLPVGGDANGSGVSFGNSARIAGKWFSDEKTAFSALLPAEEKDADVLYWRAVTFNNFILSGWEQSDTRAVDVAAGTPLLDASAEEPDPKITRTVRVTVTPADFRGNEILSVGTPASVDQDTTVNLVGEDGWFGSAQVPLGTGQYTVDAQVLDFDDTKKISENLLRAAAEVYPPDVTALYTNVPDGAMGPDAQALLEEVKAGSPSADPYDLAKTMVRILSNKDAYTYDTNVTDLDCTSISQVECFARYKRGYCLHYASTMAILLRAANRDNPIPTRLVEGFLPGDRVGNTETVRNLGAHAWVEVYFPSFGWVPFDPTGPGVGRASPLRTGAAVAPLPMPSFGVDTERDPLNLRPNVSGAETPSTSGQPADRTLLIALTVLVALLVGGAAFAAWFRGPRGEISPDRAWLTMSKVASRLGFGPRANQTVYEYATSLGELVPVARADLATVADAKVETSYARVRLGGDRLHAVGQATRRLRVSLLRLAFRRGRRTRRPRSI